jgi:hypothetical protein
MNTAVIEKPKTPATRIRRTERLPAGWFWHTNMSVTNRQVDKQNNLFIVYLTSGLQDEKTIARHITEVVKNRKHAELAQAAQAGDVETE